jgi:aminoglycoside phosphotransferase family enzyme
MARIQIKIPRRVVQKYLDSREGRRVRILKYEKLGSGWHGTGYMIRFRVSSKEKELVLRTLMPSDFSHDYSSDRAKVFILQHEMAHGIPGHVRSYDVAGYEKGGSLVSLGDVSEYFQAVQVARGTPYSHDFQRIKETGWLLNEDREKAKALASYLLKLHAIKFKGTKGSARSLRRRHSRDALGHGEMMIGVVDTYPDGFKFISKAKLTGIICKAAAFREKIKDIPYIPCRIHGDFHPSNIIFNGGRISVLDASREVYGDPADDVIAMAINYIWFAVMQSGSFKGPFAELFRIFWSSYFKMAANRHILRTAGIFFAFRGVVVAHPVFYSAQSDDVRRKMMRLVDRLLSASSFNPNRINDYLR